MSRVEGYDKNSLGFKLAKFKNLKQYFYENNWEDDDDDNDGRTRHDISYAVKGKQS